MILYNYVLPICLDYPISMDVWMIGYMHVWMCGCMDDCPISMDNFSSLTFLVFNCLKLFFFPVDEEFSEMLSVLRLISFKYFFASLVIEYISLFCSYFLTSHQSPTPFLAGKVQSIYIKFYVMHSMLYSNFTNFSVNLFDFDEWQINYNKPCHHR